MSLIIFSPLLKIEQFLKYTPVETNQFSANVIFYVQFILNKKENMNMKITNSTVNDFNSSINFEIALMLYVRFHKIAGECKQYDFIDSSY